MTCAESIQISNRPLYADIETWTNRLDPQRRRLCLPCGTYIGEKDMQLLRGVVLGTPRKLLADQLCLSVKAVEKRLTKLRTQLPAHRGSTIQWALHERGLINFLLMRPCWFSYLAAEE